MQNDSISRFDCSYLTLDWMHQRVGADGAQRASE